MYQILSHFIIFVISVRTCGGHGRGCGGRLTGAALWRLCRRHGTSSCNTYKQASFYDQEVNKLFIEYLL